MSYDQHDMFRDRLSALPLGAGRRGIAAMVLVEIVRWMPEEGAHCTKTAEQLAVLLNLRLGDMLSAIATLETLGVVETVRRGPATLLALRPLAPAKSPEQLEKEIVEAIHCHTAWKRRLRHAIDSGTAEVTVEEVARDDRCEFGQWLAGSAFSEANRDGSYEAVCQLHGQFHRVAAATLQLALNGRKDEAERSMGAGGLYARASLRLSRALSAWRGAVTS